MLSYIIRRLAIAVPTLVLVSIFVFTLQKLLPGDPALVMAGEERDPASIEFIREKYHLNEPVITQYVYWMKAVLQGDMGVSLRTSQPVLDLIGDKLPVTIQLAIMALIIARSEEHTSELQSLMRISYAVFCLKKKHKN